MRLDRGSGRRNLRLVRAGPGRTFGELLDPRAVREVGAVVERALLDLLDGLQIAPALHGVRELTLLQRMASGEVTFDAGADGEVRRLFADGALVERLGIGTNGSSTDTLAAISARARHWKARANNEAFAGRREAAEIVARSY